MSRRRKQVTIDIGKLVIEHGACYFDTYWAKEFAAQTKCREEDALQAIRGAARRYTTKKTLRLRNFRYAAELIEGWYNTAAEFSIKKLSDFVLSRDPACVWAVFLARGI